MFPFTLSNKSKHSGNVISETSSAIVREIKLSDWAWWMRLELGNASN